jgi:hypothetical protein
MCGLDPKMLLVYNINGSIFLLRRTISSPVHKYLLIHTYSFLTHKMLFENMVYENTC